MALWEWNSSLKRYQITADGILVTGQKPGTIIGHGRMVQLRDQYNDKLLDRANVLSDDLATGKIDIQGWIKGMRDNTKNAYINQYLLAHGGRNSMTPADWGRLGNVIKKQYGYLQGMGHEIADGKLSEAQIKARANMYINGATSQFERAAVLTRGIPDLPAYPADGSQICLSNCRCNWSFVDKGESWEATWNLEQGAEHCSTCLDNASNWAPLVLIKESL